MIIFFGTRQVIRNDNRLGEGVRQCARCGQFGVFKPRRAQTFVHLFWIPLIPIDAGRPLIECPNCEARFEVTM